MQSRCKELFHRFQLAKQPGPHSYHWATHHDGGGNWHVVIGGIIHGNEVGSLPGLVTIAEKIAAKQFKFPHKLTIFLGNPEATLNDCRFLESDLNRCFLRRPEETFETKRAQELIPILEQADLFIDLHQTIRHTERPFYIFPHREDSLKWAEHLDLSQTYVDATPGNAPSDTRCADEFVWLRNKPAITVELSEKGFNPESDRLTLRLFEKLLQAESVPPQSDSSKLEILHTSHREPYGLKTRRLRPGLTNFTPVVAGDNLARIATPEIIVPTSGYLLFPKYPPENPDGSLIHQAPNHIFRIIS